MQYVLIVLDNISLGYVIDELESKFQTFKLDLEYEGKENGERRILALFSYTNQ